MIEPIEIQAGVLVSDEDFINTWIGKIERLFVSHKKDHKFAMNERISIASEKSKSMMLGTVTHVTETGAHLRIDRRYKNILKGI
jgi:hypothetical protein